MSTRSQVREQIPLERMAGNIHHRDTEDTKDAQRLELSLCPLCLRDLCVKHLMPDLQLRIALIFCSILCLLIISSSMAIAKPKWKVLFDGNSTDAWRGFRRDYFPSKCWAVENGTLKTVVGCEKADRVDLITKDKYQNFELELEWRVAPGGNSGIVYLVSEDEDEVWKTGLEMQVLDDEKHHDGKIPKTSAGAVFDLIAPTNKTLRPVGEYNKARLIVRNNHVEHWLNGKKIIEYELGSDTFKSLIAQSKFKEYPRFAQIKEGHIALQHHGEEVWYRKVRIRELPAK